MSWTRITGDLDQVMPVYVWVGGHEGSKWKQTKAVWRNGAWWDLAYEGLGTHCRVTHRITHFAPFEAPEPPPKPVSLERAGREARRFLLEHYSDLPSESLCAAALRVATALDVAIAGEEAKRGAE